MIEQRARLRGIAAQHLQDAAGLLAALEGPVEGATEVCPMPGVLTEWKAGENNALTYTLMGIVIQQAAESILNAQVPPQPEGERGKEGPDGTIEEVPEVRA